MMTSIPLMRRIPRSAVLGHSTAGTLLQLFFSRTGSARAAAKRLLAACHSQQLCRQLTAANAKVNFLIF